MTRHEQARVILDGEASALATRHQDNLMKRFLIVLSLLICFHSSHADTPPNIVLILADDLGFGDVSMHGCADIPTPNIDSIAADGVRFSSGYSSHPFCSPMRAGLMAGRYQHRFGYTNNVAYDPHNDRMGLPASEKTIASRLKAAGYQTGMVGKWHLGAAANFHPLRRGFDFFYGFLGGGHDYFVVDTTVKLGENYKAALDDNGRPDGLDGYLTDVLTDQAIRFIDSVEPTQPYFVYVAYNAPHGPLQAPEEKIQQFASIKNKKRRTYAAMVSAMDDQIGRLLQTIQSRGQTDNTIVYFLSDNGGPENANASDNGPLRGEKGDVYEGGIHVPFAMRYPAKVDAGTVCDSLVISFDITATSLAEAGASDEKLEGENLIAIARGEVADSESRSLFWHNTDQRAVAVRSGNQKWIRADGETGLYNLSDDLGETNNLAESSPDAVNELAALLQSWQSQNAPSFFPSYRQYHVLLKDFHEQVEQTAKEMP